VFFESKKTLSAMQVFKTKVVLNFFLLEIPPPVDDDHRTPKTISFWPSTGPVI